MSQMKWIANRLRSMSLREMLHRSFKAIVLINEKHKTDKGWEPRPLGDVGSGCCLFGNNEGLIDSWKRLFDEDLRGWAAVANGYLNLFSNTPVYTGKSVDWHRDPGSGIRTASHLFGRAINYRNSALVGDVKLIWEIGRHQHLVCLAVGYVITGNTLFKQAIARQIEDWIDKNPFNRGIHWCSSLEVALRSISWAMIHSLFFCRDGGAGIFDSIDNVPALKKSIFHHAWFVAHNLSRHSSANNHLIGELTGLWTISQVFDLGLRGQSWSAQAKRELEREAQLQVHVDGVSKEQAIYYHLWVLEYLLFASLVGKKTGNDFSAGFDTVISRMSGFLDTITPAGGLPPNIGDSDDGFVNRFDVAHPENPYQDIQETIHAVSTGCRKNIRSQKAFWYSALSGDGVCTSFKSAIVQQRLPVVFPAGGYAVLGDTTTKCIFDAGELGYLSIAAHGHADALSVVIAVDNEWWLTDPGTYAYHDKPEWRNYFRGTSAHNTLVVDNRDQSKPGGPFLWAHHARAALLDCSGMQGRGQIATGIHYGYETMGIVHRREVHYDPDSKTYRINDQVTGNGKHELALNFHFFPGTDVRRDAVTGAWQIKRSDSPWKMTVSPSSEWNWKIVSGCLSPIAGWHSHRLNQKRKSVTLCGEWAGELPVQAETGISLSVINSNPSSDKKTKL